MFKPNDACLLVHFFVPKYNCLRAELRAESRWDQKEHVRATHNLRMPHAAFESSINTETERVDSVNYESFVCAHHYYVLVVVKCNVGHVFSFLKLGTKRREVCL